MILNLAVVGVGWGQGAGRLWHGEKLIRVAIPFRAGIPYASGCGLRTFIYVIPAPFFIAFIMHWALSNFPVFSF